MATPIFIIPFARSGGTLLVTMLDAHSQIAMSYEIYAAKLVQPHGQPYHVGTLIQQLQSCSHHDTLVWLRRIHDNQLRSFLACARRGGVDLPDVLLLLQQFQDQGGSWSTQAGRLDFIEMLMRLKAQRQNKPFWGGKAKIDPRVLYQRYPQARFFMMVRDGRDVLASRLVVGNFQTSAQQCAWQWRQALLDFMEFQQQCPHQAWLIPYERLATAPTSVLSEICAKIGVEFESVMLRFEQQDLTLFRNLHGHLSGQQLLAGLNTSSIGRWQRELDPSQVRTFEQINHDLLAHFGYV